MKTTTWHLRCISCQATYNGDERRYRCDCGGTLDVVHDWSRGASRPSGLKGPAKHRSDLEDTKEIRLTAPLATGGRRQVIGERSASPVGLPSLDGRLGSRNPIERSGVWRYRELVLPLDDEHVVSRGEGNTGLYTSAAVASYAGLGPTGLHLKHEGENPTASFKDRGMTVGVSMALRLGAKRVACASTGNTSASMAAYAAVAGMEALVFVPEGKVAYGKLSQALAYGARTIQIAGDFDDAMRLVEQLCEEEDVYLLNSVNPFRVEGQKAIAFELLQDLGWQVPDWIVVPGGNLGNISAISKGLMELRELKLIPRLPRLAVVQAAGANPFYQAWTRGDELRPLKAHTLATAIRIGNPVSWQKALRGLSATNGVVTQAMDQEILDAKAQIDGAGIGCEPASAATVAGIKKLVERGVIDADADVCAVLTGHLLKDPDTTVAYHQSKLGDRNIQPAFPNAPVSVAAEIDAIKRIL
jgi:threonine synthase